MTWVCVHIPQAPISKAVNRAFYNLLKHENALQGGLSPPVYCQSSPNGDGLRYFFSAEAAARYAKLLEEWAAYEVEQPPLELMTRVL